MAIQVFETLIELPKQLRPDIDQCPGCGQERPLQVDKFKEFYICQECFSRQSDSAD